VERGPKLCSTLPLPAQQLYQVLTDAAISQSGNDAVIRPSLRKTLKFLAPLAIPVCTKLVVQPPHLSIRIPQDAAWSRLSVLGKDYSPEDWFGFLMQLAQEYGYSGRTLQTRSKAQKSAAQIQNKARGIRKILVGAKVDLTIGQVIASWDETTQNGFIVSRALDVRLVDLLDHLKDIFLVTVLDEKSRAKVSGRNARLNRFVVAMHGILKARFGKPELELSANLGRVMFDVDEAFTGKHVSGLLKTYRGKGR
jgi:hypothetical protein